MKTECDVNRHTVSVVAPFYNEEFALAELIQQMQEAMSHQASEWEFILVDDASTDGGRQLVLEAAALDPRIRLVPLHQQCGQSAALWLGLELCRGQVIVTLDADLQNPPSEIPRLLHRLQAQEVDLVSGIRVRRQDSFSRRLASKLGNRIRRLILQDPFLDSGCSLRAYKAEFVKNAPLFAGMHRFLPVIATWNGARVVQIPVEHRPRSVGESKYQAVRGRALTGAFDLLGLLWLRRRWLVARKLTDRTQTRRTAVSNHADLTDAYLAENGSS